MPPFPDFGDTTRFPPFLACPPANSSDNNNDTHKLPPLAPPATDDPITSRSNSGSGTASTTPSTTTTSSSSPAGTSSSSSPPSNYYLLGTIAENMTVSTSPTFILHDRAGTAFALTLRVPPAQRRDDVPGGGFDARRFRRGVTLVVPGARRSGSGREGTEGKAGFVEVPSGDVRMVPTSVEKLLAMSAQEKDRADALASGEEEEEKEEKGWCQGCREVKAVAALARCKGCGSVWYCDKNCQTTGWSEKGHKSDCKVFRAVEEIF
ncbi:zinc finger, mynd-type domain containing protein [Drepanopeziza brunnea f. sp. 'multigermtubi' MB_m1]|uniref:Zinc finger, mynd-type domain containing protein n=1 Tax=Marssonina brunnea f. sp. multigermtubi (strain MB_m1) TaxID=1072389 RepID=K1WD13_MARBU|nr:zinc finger, mynd-type domain containing protein [Drepanopeziza brunnea f. sp. 'multigermtubi' MB_m1]EKD15275.1 zinc finger, mynd-type domain containing protein [Drepanopeziza brunnea f. sp. 'multigermtubi' MB_m1]